MSEFFAAFSRAIGQILFWVMIEPWEQAIRVRAGKHVRRLAPGFHWRIPILDVVYKQAVRLRSSLIPTQTLTTLDGHTLVVGAVLAYAVGDIEKLYRGLHHAEDTIAQLAAGEIAAVVASMTRDHAQPKAVAALVEAGVIRALETYGITQVSLRLSDFAYIRAFRLIQEGRWAHGKSLNTEPRA